METQELNEELPIYNLNSDNRAQGCHVSKLIAEFGKEHKIAPFNKPDTVLDKYGNCFSLLGFTWERLLEMALKDLLGVRVCEIEYTLPTGQKIYGNPDGINLTRYPVPVIEEYKCSWSNGDKKKPWDEWRYMEQVKCYCKMTGIYTAVFRILYVNGNYAPNFPFYRTYMITFTQEEIDNTWNRLIDFGKLKGMI